MASRHHAAHRVDRRNPEAVARREALIREAMARVQDQPQGKPVRGEGKSR